MLGFATGLSVELATGNGILTQVLIAPPPRPATTSVAHVAMSLVLCPDTSALLQVGLEPSPQLFAELLTLIGGSTLIASFLTLSSATSGKMSPLDVARYGRLLGMKLGAEGMFDEYGLPARSSMAVPWPQQAVPETPGAAPAAAASAVAAAADPAVAVEVRTCSRRCPPASVGAL